MKSTKNRIYLSSAALLTITTLSLLTTTCGCNQQDSQPKAAMMQDSMPSTEPMKDGMMQDGMMKDGMMKDGMMKDGMMKDGSSPAGVEMRSDKKM